MANQAADVRPHPILLLGASVEALLLTFVFGYLSAYAHLVLHAGDLLASLATAGPTAAIFLGSTLWGRVARRGAWKALVCVGLFSYALLALALAVSRSAGALIGLAGVATLGTAALRPATAAYLAAPGGAVGRRLAMLLRWQSFGWLSGGALSGLLLARSLAHLPVVVMVLGGALAAVGVWALASLPLPQGVPSSPKGERTGRLPGHAWPLLLSFFFVYAGYQGMYTTFGLYLAAVHLPLGWIGYTVGISTSLGSLAAGYVGDLADALGGQGLYRIASASYLLCYALMAALGSGVFTLAVFSLPLFSGLQVAVQRGLAEGTPRAMLGQAMGAYNAATGIATAAGAAAMGAFDARLGAGREPFLALALVVVGVALHEAWGRARWKPAPASTSGAAAAGRGTR